MTTDLDWLAAWFAEQTDGDWEHQYGVTIETLDNPGWSLRIDLSRTLLEHAPFPPEVIEDGRGWMQLRKDHGTAEFRGACSPSMLAVMVARFRDWVVATTQTPHRPEARRD